MIGVHKIVRLGRWSLLWAISPYRHATVWHRWDYPHCRGFEFRLGRFSVLLEKIMR